MRSLREDKNVTHVLSVRFHWNAAMSHLLAEDGWMSVYLSLKGRSW